MARQTKKEQSEFCKRCRKPLRIKNYKTRETISKSGYCTSCGEELRTKVKLVRVKEGVIMTNGLEERWKKK